MKLITWNVQWFCGIDNVVSVERVLQAARAMADFDVLCLQEVAVNYPGLEGVASADQPAQLEALMKQIDPAFQVFFGATVDEWRVIKGQEAKGLQRQRFGNLIATRLPLLQVQHHALPYPHDAGLRSMPRMCSVVTLQDPALGAVRIMTTHLEFYSTKQRMAQAKSIVGLHEAACQQAANPPELDELGGPFQAKTHTASAILCGDFNFETDADEYHVLQSIFKEKTANVTAIPSYTAIDLEVTKLQDAWLSAHPGQPHAPTFRLHDRRYGPEPIACDFVFVSEDLVHRIQSMRVDFDTQASDHQPVLITFA